MSNLASMYSYCTSPLSNPNLGPEVDQGPTGLNGSWTFNTVCPASATRTCTAKNFGFGNNKEYTIESAVTSYYNNAQLSSGDICSGANGTVVPPVVGKCENISGNLLCIETNNIGAFSFYTSQCSSWGGTFNPNNGTCAAATNGTCAASIGGPVVARFYSPTIGAKTSQQWCEQDMTGAFTP